MSKEICEPVEPDKLPPIRKTQVKIVLLSKMQHPDSPNDQPVAAIVIGSDSDQRSWKFTSDRQEALRADPLKVIWITNYIDLAAELDRRNNVPAGLTCCCQIDDVGYEGRIDEKRRSRWSANPKATIAELAQLAITHGWVCLSREQGEAAHQLFRDQRDEQGSRYAGYDSAPLPGYSNVILDHTVDRGGWYLSSEQSLVALVTKAAARRLISEKRQNETTAYVSQLDQLVAELEDSISKRGAFPAFLQWANIGRSCGSRSGAVMDLVKVWTTLFRDHQYRKGECYKKIVRRFAAPGYLGKFCRKYRRRRTYGSECLIHFYSWMRDEVAWARRVGCCGVKRIKDRKKWYEPECFNQPENPNKEQTSK